ncbi:hypothetical protein JD488_06260 [Aeromonas jandaei]|uniref:hypothetical protein n=1 Tax=Aeromonas jandaei TaxID=650 RepID=UPI00191D4598|nr:hypothetical protein [Aeromonas jandaei]MBL0666298.1 hypothetical protein [Aeromonas jandaei]MBL0666308.1 hypothetical protein [Aeromonas jandaei]
MGNVTIATPLPVCVKFDGVKLGGCFVNCKGVCVELPLANSKGPVETTGEVCNIGGGGDGDGDKGGSGGGTPDPESKPKWNYFEPSQGDATGTSVSSAIAKLNRNLGDSFRSIDAGLELGKMEYSRINEISGDTTRIVNASEAAQQALKEISEYNRIAGHRLEGLELYISRIGQKMEESNIHLKKIADKGDDSGSGGSSGGDTSGIDRELKQFHQNMFGPDFAQNNIGANMYGLLNGYSYDISSIKEKMHTLNSNVDNLYWKTMPDLRNNSIEMNKSLKSIADAMKNGTGSGGGDGKGIDYSQMPGSDGNPLSVKRGQYNSKCEGGDCFFDVSGIKKELDKANKSLSDKHGDIAKEVKDIFSFNLSGSADVMDCFELFSYSGKTYQVCPPSQNYWQTLAALMMFIFYFIALMVIFKR